MVNSTSSYSKKENRTLALQDNKYKYGISDRGLDTLPYSAKEIRDHLLTDEITITVEYLPETLNLEIDQQKKVHIRLE